MLYLLVMFRVKPPLKNQSSTQVLPDPEHWWPETDFF